MAILVVLLSFHCCALSLFLKERLNLDSAFLIANAQDQSGVVIDHESYVVSGTEGDHTLIAAYDFIQADVLLGSTKIKMLVFHKGTIFCNCYLELYSGFTLPMLWQKQLNVEEVKGINIIYGCACRSKGSSYSMFRLKS